MNIPSLTFGRRFLLSALVLALGLCRPSGARADEGMWMTGNIAPKTYEAMRAMGLALPPDGLYNDRGTGLQGSVVLFGGFCTGVAVSPEGLVFTNHHCGFSSIHAHSTPQNDYLRHGFYAPSKEEEWPVPGLYVSFPVRSECVTARVLPLLLKAGGPAGSQVWGHRRQVVIDSLQKVMQAEVSAADSTLRADLVPYFGGNDFYLNVYRDYTDVRLVMAPPVSAGKFGGETDNWMWPRQTCDFSVFRIYARNGQPAPYSPDNTPLRPKTYAPISLRGYREGDFAMTMGFPGSTYRYLSSYGINFRVRTVYEPLIQVRTVKQALWREAMQADSVINLLYSNKYASSSNAWKKYKGMCHTLSEKNVIAGKQAFERTLQEWIESDTAMLRKYGNLFTELRDVYCSDTLLQRESTFYSETFTRNVEMLNLASAINVGAFDTSHPYVEERLAAAEKYYRGFNSALDRRTLSTLMRNYASQVPVENLPSCYLDVATRYAGNYDRYVDDLYRRSLLPDSARTLRLLRKGKAARLDKDPLVLLSRSVMKRQACYGGFDRNRASEAERRLQEAIHEMYARSAFYPDANMTVRMSYGRVSAYSPAPGQTSPFYTTAATLVEKTAQSASVPDYFMEPGLKDLIGGGSYGPYADSDGTLHLCFITDNDITGGNSGSPVFNGRGELMGLAFDGNWESMANDLKYDPALTRCINVDIRYVLFLMQHWTKAGRLLRELSLRRD